MESHATAVCKSTIFHLRNISRIRRYPTAAAREQIIHAFVISRGRANHLLQADFVVASEANTTASESAELGSPLDRRRHES